MTATPTTPSSGPARASLGWAALRLQSDQYLTDLVADGYEQAFDAIVERYRTPLLRYATALVGVDRAEDVVQLTFEKLLDRLRNDRRELVLRAWLYRVCHNASINVLERKGADYEQLDENFDGVPQPPDIVERRQSLRSVLRQVRGLPDRQRSALMLSAVAGMSYEQIAGDMHVSPPVVRQLLYRARVSLRNALGAAVPAPVIRLWLAGTTPDHSHIAELVAGGGAGAGVIKATAAVFAAGVVATGAGVTASQQGHSYRAAAEAKQSAPAAPGSVQDESPVSTNDDGHDSGDRGEHGRGSDGRSDDGSRHEGGSGGPGERRGERERGDNSGPQDESESESDGGHGGPGDEHGGSGESGEDGTTNSGPDQSGSDDGGSGQGESGGSGGSDSSGSGQSGSGGGGPGPDDDHVDDGDTSGHG